VVTAVSPGCIEVELDAWAGCPGCAGACGWYGESISRRVIVATRNALPVGTSVTVGVANGGLLRGAAIVYGLPAAAVLGGALIGFAASGSDVGTAAGLGAGLAIALAAAQGLRARLERGARRALTVMRVS